MATPTSLPTNVTAGTPGHLTHTNIVHTAVNELTNAPAGGSTVTTSTMLNAGVKAATTADFITVPNSQAQIDGNTNWVMKMYTPTAITVTQVMWMFIGTAGAGCAGWYTAFFDSTGTLIPNSASADLGPTLNQTQPGTTQIRGDGGPVSIAAGLFYMSLRSGTATTFPRALVVNCQFSNPFLTSGANASDSLAPRFGFPSNGWSGSTPPATLGTISADYRAWAVGVR